MLYILFFVYTGGAIVTTMFFTAGVAILLSHGKNSPESAKMINDLLKFWVDMAGKHIFLWPWYMVVCPLYYLVQIQRGKMEPLKI